MCRGKDQCSELDTDPARWDKNSPLPPPKWIEEEISKFTQSVEYLISGKRGKCIDMLSTIRDAEFTNWYIEHGQMSGKHRKNLLGIKKPELLKENLRDPLRAPKKFQNEVFARDNYHCRYCGSRLISQKFIKLFIQALDSDIFKRGKTNLTTHGIIHATWPVADHVIPWNIGGKTNPDNLVSSCATCNYGKDGYTCEQLGILNPFEQPPVADDWDGLVSKELHIKAYNNALK